MTFARAQSSFMFLYSLNDTVIFRVDCVTNIDLMLNYNLFSGPHIENLCCNALKTVDFVMWLAKTVGLNYRLNTIL